MLRQPILVPERARRIAVVRIGSDQDFAAHRDDAALFQSAVASIVSVSRQPGIAALQIDFDARKSERAFYRHPLAELRQQMPLTLPLDNTALVSWCSTDDWISDLPINAAHRIRIESRTDVACAECCPKYQLHEPLCASSVGVFTTEPWPQNVAGKLILLFADRGWARGTDVLPYSHSFSGMPKTSMILLQSSRLLKVAIHSLLALPTARACGPNFFPNTWPCSWCAEAYSPTASATPAIQL